VTELANVEGVGNRRQHVIFPSQVQFATQSHHFANEHWFCCDQVINIGSLYAQTNIAITCRLWKGFSAITPQNLNRFGKNSKHKRGTTVGYHIKMGKIVPGVP